MNKLDDLLRCSVVIWCASASGASVFTTADDILRSEDCLSQSTPMGAIMTKGYEQEGKILFV